MTCPHVIATNYCDDQSGNYFSDMPDLQCVRTGQALSLQIPNRQSKIVNRKSPYGPAAIDGNRGSGNRATARSRQERGQCPDLVDAGEAFARLRGKQHVAAAAGLNSAIWPVTGGPARIVVYALPLERSMP